MTIRVLIADDHAVVAEGLRHLIGGQPDMEVLACVHDGREAVRLAAKMNPDVVLIDNAMPELNGTEVPDPLPRTMAPELDREHIRLMADKLAEQVDLLQATNSRLAALTELNVQLASELDPEVLLTKVCRGARELIGARYAMLGVTARSDGDAGFFTTSGIDAAVAGTLALPWVGDGPLGELLGGSQPRRIANPDGDPTAVGLPPGFPPAHSLLAAPVISLHSTYGGICLANKLGADAFTAEDERLLGILGTQVGRIYENGSLYLEVKHHAEQLQTEIVARKRATEELRESEFRFRQLADNMRGVFFLTDTTNTRMLYVSPAYQSIWGRTCESLYARPESWSDSIHPDDRARLAAANRARDATGEVDFEYRIVRPDGTLRWIWTRGLPIRNDAGEIYRVAGVAEDITERKLAETRIHRLNRIYAMLSGTNALIVRVQERDELFKEACRLAVEQSGFRLAWIGMLDPGTQEFKPVAWAGADQGFVQAFKLSLQSGPAGEASLFGAAIRAGQPLVLNNIEAEGRPLMYRDAMLERGYRSAAGLPLVVGDQSIGYFALYSDEPGFFDEEEMHLLTDLAGDISFAVDHIEKAERLHYLAYHDALTGLANRTLFHDRLSHYLDTARRAKRKLVVVVADVGRFSTINDTFGRHAGDEMLKLLGVRMVHCVGNPNEVARIGGDQFAAVMPDVTGEREVLQTLGEWWRYTFDSSIVAAGGELKLSAKAGIAFFPDDGNDADTLLRNAETALNKAKATGDKYVFYAQQITERVAAKLALETQLRQGLENDEFVLYYQPMVDVATRRIEGVEALMRWQHPAQGLMLPGAFIPLMEETRMILEAGTWALRRAALDRAGWLEQNLKAPRVAVNLSAIQLRQPEFIATVKTALEAGAAEPGIDVEVTESVMMDDLEGVLRKIEALRDLGVTIAIDDFGTGHSSLAYLATLPVQTLKIDRVFISAMLDNASAMTLVSTMISLAHALNLKAIAEGVESEEQAKILRLLRCDQMQGYLISRPLPLAEMTRLLEKNRG
jgi:diguanylate cyclase